MNKRYFIFLLTGITIFAVTLSALYWVAWEDFYIFTERPAPKTVTAKPKQVKPVQPSKAVGSKLDVDARRAELMTQYKRFSTLKRELAKLTKQFAEKDYLRLENKRFTKLQAFIKNHQFPSMDTIEKTLPKLEKSIRDAKFMNRLMEIKLNREQMAKTGVAPKNSTSGKVAPKKDNKQQVLLTKETQNLISKFTLVKNSVEESMKHYTRAQYLKYEKGRFLKLEAVLKKYEEPALDQLSNSLKGLTKAKKDADFMNKLVPIKIKREQIAEKNRLQNSPDVINKEIAKKLAELKKLKLYQTAVITPVLNGLEKFINQKLKQVPSLASNAQTKGLQNQFANLKRKAQVAGLNMIGVKAVTPENYFDAKIHDKTALERQRKAANELGLPLMIENSAGMLFRFIPAGEFMMGSPKDESGRDSIEKQHKVVISRPFYMQINEVTSNNYSYRKDSKTGNVPMKKIRVTDVIKFVENLNRREKNPCSLYQLPTEAMWEYACRADSTGESYHEDRELIANYNSSFTGNHSEVRKFKPNSWGLYDMLGNVWEFCQDKAESYLFTPSTPDTYIDGIKDPVSIEGSDWVIRGGSWRDGNSDVRAAKRKQVGKTYRSSDLGFRVARRIEMSLDLIQ